METNVFGNADAGLIAVTSATGGGSSSSPQENNTETKSATHQDITNAWREKTKGIHGNC